ncbi:MAG: alpha/beta hydrolase [Spirochaetales bacterium]|nr:alpha/beta hydrolase [Spirochaetales bacterium]
MKKFFTILLAVLSVSCTSMNKADVSLPMGESTITLPSGAMGTILIADGNEAPFVIMYHGYASTKDEVGNMFKDEAARLQAMGVSSLRIGYRGWDGPEFDQTFLSVHTMMEDAQEALDYVRSLPYADNNKIALLGFSMGGGVAQYIAGTNAKKVAAVATWSSSIEYASLMEEEDKQAAVKEGQVELDLGWRKITHSQEFVESLDSYNPLETSKKYTGPFLIVDGTDDYLYPNTAVLKETHPRAEVFEIQGADHIYHVLSGDTTLSDMAIDKTADWFKEQLQ